MPPKRAFRNSKSVEQERNVSDLLGPPRDVVDVVDVPDLDLNYEVRDEELCNMPMPSEVFHIDKGGKFLKKLWCCVGGSITR